jgi:magnesium-transporting ATPase (P-type)
MAAAPSTRTDGVLLWCLDEYLIYSIYTLCSLLMFECVQAYSRYKSVRRLREDAVGGSVYGCNGGKNGDDDDGTDAVECYLMGSWTTVPARRLVVGDLVSLVSPSSHHTGDAAGGGGGCPHHFKLEQ